MSAFTTGERASGFPEGWSAASAALGLLLVLLSVSACRTGGAAWTQEPLTAEADFEGAETPASAMAEVALETEPRGRSLGEQFRTRIIPGDPLDVERTSGPGGGYSSMKSRRLAGRVLGTFRNTYYNFPSEREFEAVPGPRVLLKDAECKTIGDVKKAFHDALCVQGSGRLTTGMTVSFAKRDCACAELCPRTDQRICYESLRPEVFPWGRGAAGRAITPLLTVAVDTNVIPMGTGIYIPEFDGAPRDLEGRGKHDGCFIAQDRGSRVTGRHVDVFTGEPALTKLYNALVPSNQGVTIVLDSPRCSRVENTP